LEEIKRLKNILLFSIVVVILFAAGTRLYIELQHHYIDEQEMIEKQISTIRLLFNHKVEDINELYTAQIQSILSDSKIVDAISKKDRSYLIKQLSPIFQLLQKSNPSLISFQIHDKDNYSLIRYEKLNAYGDKVYNFRKILQNAHKTETTQYGLDIGLYDKEHLTYRVVTPIIRNGDYCGILEFGVAIDLALSSTSEIISRAIGEEKHFRIAFKVRNDSLALENSENLMEFGTYSIPIYDPEISDILNRFYRSGKTPSKIRYGDQILMLVENSFHITNFLKEKVATVVVILDVSDIAKRKNLLIEEGLTKPAIVVIFLFSLVMIFFNIILKRFKRIKKKIENSYVRLKTILDSQPNIIVITNGKKLIDANRAFFEFFNYSSVSKFLKKYNCICDLFEREEGKDYLQAEMGELTWVEYVQQHSEKSHKAKIGEKIFNIHIEGYLSENGVNEFVVVFNDITVFEKHQEELHYLAYIDTLTQLPNRADFLDTLRQNITMNYSSDDRYALMFLDLDKFKQINDVHGHNVGDWLLRQTSSRLVSLLEDCYIARLGGDEFVIFFKEYRTEEYLSNIAKHVIEIINREFVYKNEKLYVGTSIGIALYPKDANDASSLLKNSDIAMYHSKKMGKNRYSFYHSSMGDEIYMRQEIENDLKIAIENGELYLVYQPQVETVSGKFVGVEVLVRWRHPTKGEIYPDQFIPIAEGSDLIIKIGEFVLLQSIRELGSLVKKHDFKVAINTTNRELSQKNFVEKIVNVCRRERFPLQNLEIEFVERDALENINHVQRIINRLHIEGVRFALDDFGTGYSSLSYINRLSVDKLKIDRSFIKNIFAESNQLAIVKSIIAIAENINMKVVAEGAELIEEQQVLAHLKCDIIQGYFISKPMKIEVFKEFIEIEQKSFFA
jgi:diguanylate cyclase (GGDEF)-like protein